jgi:hypothetical protein
MHNPLNLGIGVGRFGHTTRKDYPRLPRIRNPTSCLFPWDPDLAKKGGGDASKLVTQKASDSGLAGAPYLPLYYQHEISEPANIS